MRKYILGVLTIMLFSTNIFGGSRITSTDARSRMQGNSVLVFNAGNDAININPAQLGAAEKTSASLTGAPYLTGIENGNIYLFLIEGVLPLQAPGALGAGFNGQLIRADYNGERINLFSELSWSIAYGLNLGKKLAFGSTLFFERWTVDKEYTGEGASNPFIFNLQLSGIWYVNEFIGFGMSVGNILGSAASAIENKSIDQAPPYFRIGGGWNKKNLTLQADFDFELGVNEFNWRLGGEKLFELSSTEDETSSGVYTGAGVEFENGVKGIKPSIGGGLILGIFDVSYAFSYPIRLGGGGDHFMTAKISF